MARLGPRETTTFRGDANVFGVVYRSTAGRGIAVWFPSPWVGVKGPARRGIAPNAAGTKGMSGSIRIFSLDGRLLHLDAARDAVDFRVPRRFNAQASAELVIRGTEGKTTVAAKTRCLK
jgi:hypothetical protein